MKIYELIYYLDDACNGTNITKTLLLTDKHKVNNKIEEFKESDSNTRELFTNYEDSYSGLDYIYFYLCLWPWFLYPRNKRTHNRSVTK